MTWTKQMISILGAPLRAMAVAAAAALTLAACGGGAGGEGDTGGAGGTGATGPASLSILKSAPTLDSDGSQTLVVTVIAKSATNASLPNQAIVVSTTDAGLTLSPGSRLTDSSGSAQFTVSTTSKSNRSATIVAQSGGVSASTTVQIVGTTVSVSGPTAVELTKSAGFTVAVRDSNGDPVTGSPVSVSSANGNPITPASSVTDGQGQALFSMTASVSGADVLSAVSAGAQSTLPVSVSTTGISIASGAAPGNEVAVNVPETVTVSLSINGVPAVGQTVTLTPTRGTLGATALVTDAAGQASTTIVSAVAGPSVVTAEAPDGTSTSLQLEFVSSTPSKLSLLASPSIVGANLPGTTQPETSQIVAVVRDAADNPVKGKTVTFQIVAGTGGLSSSQAVTDSSGQASVVYTPGASPSGTNGIQILATVQGTAISQLVPLTVNQRELTVSVGTGNETIKVSEVYNETPYGVLVSDSAGAPVSGVGVSPSVVAIEYAKGYWVRNVLENRWDQVVTAVCSSEDLNANLLLDAGEDFNGNGQLDPRNADALVQFEGSNITDASGSVNLRVRYLRDRSAWVRVRLRVTATIVAGTEGAAETQFYLPILASEVSNLNQSPPGVVSPYGVSNNCADPN